MKNLIIFFVALLIGSAQAQVKTGGGTDYTEFQPIFTYQKRLHKFTSHLRARDKICREDKRYLDIEADFVQTYTKLSVLKSSFVADNKCEDVSTYLKCLSDKKTKWILKDINEDKELKKFIQIKYQINEKELNQIFDFYNSMSKGCAGKVKCE